MPRFKPIPVTQGVAYKNKGIENHIHGWVVSETGGSTALVVTLYTATSSDSTAGGRVDPAGSGTDFAFAIINVPAGTGPVDLIDHEGFAITGGLYIKTSGGTAGGSILVR